MNVLAIDQGTSSTKALVVAGGGRVLGEGNAPVHPQAGSEGAVEQDPQELLQSIVDAGRAALDAAGAEVEAVGLGNQGETVLRWDRESGEPYGPALSWQDRRAVSVTRDLADHEERLTELSGLPLDPYFAAPKMFTCASPRISDCVALPKMSRRRARLVNSLPMPTCCFIWDRNAC